MKPAAMAKAVVVHDLDQAAMALAVAASLKEPVAIWSSPYAALELGVGWFAGLMRRAQAGEPHARAVFVLDCGDRADLVQDAFREGLSDACFTGRAAVAARLADIARKSRARLHRKRPRAVDLGALRDPEGALRAFLGGN
jgi:hypothetical protein